jgi:Gpi18-like mannosyltransferase
MVELELGTEVASRCLWYLALFPGSLFFLAPYSESLFLLLAVGCLYAARTDHWWMAGFMGLLLGLTRNLGVLIAIPLLFEVFRQRRGLVRVFLVPLGVLSWMAFWYFKSGDAFAFVRAQAQWERQARFPWMTVFDGVEQAWQFALTYPGGIYIFEALVVVLFVVLGFMGFVLLAPSYSSFFWCMLLPSLVAPYPGRTLMSCIRFASVIFPGFIVLGRVAAVPRIGPGMDQAVRAGLAGLYGLAVALFVSNQNMF